MTPEEKINVTKELLYSCYLAQENEAIRISSAVLEDEGLAGPVFFDIICPELKAKGFLKSYQNAFVGLMDPDSFVDSGDKEKANKIFNKSYRQFSSRELLFNPAAASAAEEQDKAREEDFKKIKAMPRYHRFVVDGPRLGHDSTSTGNSTQRMTEKFPHPLSTNVIWEHITIKFVDGHEVDIIVGANEHKTNYSKMNFQNQITRNPNKIWEFLEKLAEHGGEANDNLLDQMGQNARNQLKSWKKQLADNLKFYFDIKDDPFPYDKQERLYKMRIHLIPASGHTQSISKKSEESMGDIMEGVDDKY